MLGVYKHEHTHLRNYQRQEGSISSFTYMKRRTRSEKKLRVMKVSWTDTASDHVTVKFYVLHSEGIYQSLI